MESYTIALIGLPVLAITTVIVLSSKLQEVNIRRRTFETQQLHLRTAKRENDKMASELRDMKSELYAAYKDELNLSLEVQRLTTTNTVLLSAIQIADNMETDSEFLMHQMSCMLEDQSTLSERSHQRQSLETKYLATIEKLKKKSNELEEFRRYEHFLYKKFVKPTQRQRDAALAENTKLKKEVEKLQHEQRQREVGMVLFLDQRSDDLALLRLYEDTMEDLGRQIDDLELDLGFEIDKVEELEIEVEVREKEISDAVAQLGHEQEKCGKIEEDARRFAKNVKDMVKISDVLQELTRVLDSELSAEDKVMIVGKSTVRIQELVRNLSGEDSADICFLAMQTLKILDALHLGGSST